MPPTPASPSLVLAIETSNPGARPEADAAPGAGPTAGPHPAGDEGPSVALGRWADAARTAVHPLGLEPVRPLGRHDDDLMPAIDRLFRRLGVTPGEVGTVAVSIGPGGYTGLRVATTTAVCIAEAVRAEVRAVPTAAAVAEALRPDQFPALVCLASKREAAWVESFGAAGDAGRTLGVLGPAEVARALAGDAAFPADVAASRPVVVVADRHLPAGLRAAAAGAGVPVVAARFSALAVLSRASREAPVDPISLVPRYGREPEAVRLWKSPVE